VLVHYHRVGERAAPRRECQLLEQGKTDAIKAVDGKAGGFQHGDGGIHRLVLR
jgi:hypothetical protein